MDYGEAWDPQSGQCWRLVYDEQTSRPVPCVEPVRWHGVVWAAGTLWPVVACEKHRGGLYEVKAAAGAGV